MRLFILKDGALQLYKDEVLLHNELAVIYKRDTGSPGDSDGRKKLRAFTEFKYLYMICDYFSYPNQKGLSSKEAHKYAIDSCDLPEKWIPDRMILDAMDFYIDANKTVARELNQELVASFKNSSRVVRKLRDTTEDLLDKTTLSALEIAQLTDMQNTLLDISVKLPKNLKALQESADLIKKEESEGEIGRGGSMILDSQNPDTSL
jgi:hypothetical protein